MKKNSLLVIALFVCVIIFSIFTTSCSDSHHRRQHHVTKVNTIQPVTPAETPAVAPEVKMPSAPSPCDNKKAVITIENYSDDSKDYPRWNYIYKSNSPEPSDMYNVLKFAYNYVYDNEGKEIRDWNYFGYTREEQPFVKAAFKWVIKSRTGDVSNVIVAFLKSMPGDRGKQIANTWGSTLINAYDDMNWDAEVGYFSGREVKKYIGSDGSECCCNNTLKEIISNPHKPERDSDGRFVNETMGSCVLDDIETYHCKSIVFADPKMEDMDIRDKLMWRAGPKFYAKMRTIIEDVLKKMNT